jgi:hypothetical protein
LLIDPESCSRMGQSGHQKVNDFYNWTGIIKRLEEIYENILA